MRDKFKVMDNILVTGAAGQLGSELREAVRGNGNFFFTYRNELDICDAAAVDSFVSSHGITKIINCAAYNNVDRAEEEPDEAFRINAAGPRAIAGVAKSRELTMIHISTDFVFNGEKRTPYHESDSPCPLSQYGKSKLAGETEVKKSGCKGIIIRTSWLDSNFGKNFVRTVKNLAETEDFLNIVADQKGTPTAAADIAEAILHIIPQLDGFTRYGEVFHYSNEGCCSRADFAEKIISLKHLECDVKRITSEEYGSPAARPRYSVLDKTMIKSVFGVKVPLWERSLSKYIRKF